MTAPKHDVWGQDAHTTGSLHITLTEGTPRIRSSFSKAGSWVLDQHPDIDAAVATDDTGTVVVVRSSCLSDALGDDTLSPVANLEKSGHRVVRLESPITKPRNAGFHFLKDLADQVGIGRLTMHISEEAFVLGHRGPKSPRPAKHPAGWPMTILFLIPSMDIGGADKVNLDLLRGLPSDRYRKIVVTTRSGLNAWRSSFRIAADGVYELAAIAHRDDEAYRFVLDLVCTESVDLIQVSNSRLGYRIAARLRSELALPMVSVVHMAVPRGPWDYIRLSSHYRKFIDATVAVTTSLKDTLVAVGFPESRVHVVPNGVDLDVFKEAPLQKRGGKTDILFVGRFVAQKDPVCFASMAASLVGRNLPRSVAFTIIGDGPLRSDVEAQLQRRGVHRHIKLVGEITNPEVLAIHLRSACLLVAPSRWEGLPIVGIEAMASGVPVLARDVSGWSDLLADGKGGVLTNGSPEDFADAVEALLTHPDRLEELSAQAALKARAGYSLEKMCAGYAALYDSFVRAL